MARGPVLGDLKPTEEVGFGSPIVGVLPGAEAEGLPVDGILESTDDGACQVGWAWRGIGGEFTGHTGEEPFGDATGSVGDAGDAKAGGFEADEAERFGPDAGYSQEIDAGHELIPLGGRDPAEVFRGEPLFSGVVEEGGAVRSIAGDDELKGTAESSLGLDQGGGEMVEALLRRDATQEQHPACGGARHGRSRVGIHARGEERDPMNLSRVDAGSFELGADIPAGDQDGGVAAEGLVATGFDSIALEHGPGVSTAAVFGEVEGETGEAEGALAGNGVLAGMAAGAADTDAVVVVGEEKRGKPAGEVGFEIGRIQSVIVDPIRGEGGDVVEHLIDGTLAGFDAWNEGTVLENEVRGFEG